MDKPSTETDRAVDEIEGRKPETAVANTDQGEPLPAAGPHATDALTHHDSTPGAGSLPDTSPEVDGGAG